MLPREYSLQKKTGPYRAFLLYKSRPVLVDVEVVMVQSRSRAGFLFVIFLLAVFLECVPQDAHARRGRRGAFGRRVARNQPRRRVGGRRAVAQRRNNGGNRRVANNNNNRNNAISNFLDNINDNGRNGDLQRLVVAPDFAVNRSGQIVALNNGDIQDPSLRALPIIDNQVVSLGGLSARQNAQIRLLNETGDFQTFNR